MAWNAGHFRLFNLGVVLFGFDHIGRCMVSAGTRNARSTSNAPIRAVCAEYMVGGVGHIDTCSPAVHTVAGVLLGAGIVQLECHHNLHVKADKCIHDTGI